MRKKEPKHDINVTIDYRKFKKEEYYRRVKEQEVELLEAYDKLKEVKLIIAAFLRAKGKDSPRTKDLKND